MADEHAYRPTCPKGWWLHFCRCSVDGCELPPEEHPDDD
jgi:hypothetical protein